jgi:hypothetical protein
MHFSGWRLGWRIGNIFLHHDTGGVSIRADMRSIITSSVAHTKFVIFTVLDLSGSQLSSETKSEFILSSSQFLIMRPKKQKGI